MLVNTPSFHQHFSKEKSDAPQAVNSKKHQTKASEIKIKETDTYVPVPLAPWDHYAAVTT